MFYYKVFRIKDSQVVESIDITELIDFIPSLNTNENIHPQKVIDLIDNANMKQYDVTHMNNKSTKLFNKIRDEINNSHNLVSLKIVMNDSLERISKEESYIYERISDKASDIQRQLVPYIWSQAYNYNGYVEKC